MMFAPHIPPPAKSIAAHHMWERIKVLITMSVVALCAGAAGAAAIMAWFLPQTIHSAQSQVFFSYHRPEKKETLANHVFENDIPSRSVVVYSAVHEQHGLVYFDPRDIVAEALPVSSDGWLMARLTSSTVSTTVWYVVGQGGNFVSTTQAVTDHASSVMYLKLSRVPAVWNTRSLDFASEIMPGEDVYLMSYGSVESGPVVPVGVTATLTEQVTLPTLPLKIDGSHASSGFVFSAAGALLGIYNEHGFIPASYFSTSLPRIFMGKEAFDARLGVAGWWGSDHPIFSNNRRMSGFYVARVIDARSVFKVGDVLQKIDGQVVDEKTAWYTNTEKISQVTVVRDGKEKVLTVSRPVFSHDF